VPEMARQITLNKLSSMLTSLLSRLSKLSSMLRRYGVGPRAVASVAVLLLIIVLALIFRTQPPEPHLARDQDPRTQPSEPHLARDQDPILVQYQGPPALSLVSGRWVPTDRYLCLSLLTAALHGQAPIVLRPVSGAETQHGKVAALHEYLKRDDVPTDRPIVFYDTDVLVIGGPPAVKDALLSFPLTTHTAVFSAERNCWPTLFPRYPTSTTSFRYVNTGMMVALKTPALLRFVEAWRRCVEDGVNDQVCVHWFLLCRARGRRYLSECPRLFLDTECKAFQNAHQTPLQNWTTDPQGRARWLDDFDRVFNPETETHPLFLHFNGDRRPMAPFVKEMWPSLTWDDPQVRDAIFSLWGEPTGGRHLCTIPLAPAPVRSKGKGPPTSLYGPDPSWLQKAWWFLLDLPGALWF